MSGERDTPVIFLRITDPSGKKEPLEITDRLISLEVIDSEKKALQADIELDNYDQTLYSEPRLRTGNTITLQWGYAGVGTMSPPHEMIIKRSSSSGAQGKKKKGGGKAAFAHRDSDVSSDTGGDSLKGAEVFKVEAYGSAFNLHMKTKSRVFHNMTRSQVARQIADEYKFPAFDVEDTKEIVETQTQAMMTDAQFLRKCAAREGFAFFIDWQGFHFHRRRTGQAPAKVYRYFTDPGAGEVLKIDEIDINIAGLAGAITLTGYDPINKTEIRERAINQSLPEDDPENRQSNLAPDTLLICPEDSTTKDQAKNISEYVKPSPQPTPAAVRREVNGNYRDHKLAQCKVKFTAVGDPTSVAKTVCSLLGVNELIVGKYYVSEIRHKVSSGGYTMQLSTRRDGTNKGGVKAAGDLNKAQPAKPGVASPITVINPETSTTETRYVDDRGRTVGGEDASSSFVTPPPEPIQSDAPPQSGP